MRISFVGANHTVTGSRYLIEINDKKIILDCGMHQGKRDESMHRNKCFPFDPASIDAVVLSHAHIDHSGNIPNLVKQGFQGPVYCTHATKDLCGYMLRDSGHIQERNAEYANKKLEKQGKPLVEPLYTEEDAVLAVSYFRGQNYYEPFEIVPGAKVTFYDAGHILGSALTFIELHNHETDEKVTFLFTGDLGRHNVPILRNPDKDKLPHVDILMTESTYGNKVHESILHAQDALEKVINETAARGGKVIIPAFALGRTQEITYELQKLREKDKIPALPVFVDSPLGVNVTQVFRGHPECFDEEALAMLNDDDQALLNFDNFTLTQSVEESKALNNIQGPAVIISSSGMCEFGRIVHHLKNNIEDPRNTILIVGYQAQHTRGKRLVEGDKQIKIFDQMYDVKAEVVVMNYFSGHADRSDLLDFADNLTEKGLKRVFVVHGDTERSNALKDALEVNGLKDKVIVPSWGEVYDISIEEGDLEPELRVACNGEYVYDKDGKLASDDEHQIGGTEVPDDHDWQPGDKTLFNRDGKKGGDSKAMPQESKKEDKPVQQFDTSGFDSSGF